MHKNFLEANMAADVAVNSGFPVATLLAEWERLRVCFPDLNVQLVRLEHGEGNAVMTVSKRSATTIDQTVRSAFPHLITEEGWSPLTDKLLGQQLVARIEGDEANAQINSVHSTTDIVTPLLMLLGNLEDVATALKNSPTKRQ
ncbi:hypothetical protein ON010_g15322 [Phytophthora cinnamomi]|nr:hypothetical protein ON010_g15322 [Phytophthora cinnamomi]